jgi:cytosine/adenosine deaminase-related metal-dependent hydrolase
MTLTPMTEDLLLIRGAAHAGPACRRRDARRRRHRHARARRRHHRHRHAHARARRAGARRQRLRRLPGWVNTHHHLFQSLLKGIPAGINLALVPWLAAVPVAYRRTSTARRRCAWRRAWAWWS